MVGFVAGVVERLGAVGTGLLVALEHVFPPIPSEVVLPLAGVAVGRDRMSLLWALVASTLGAVAGGYILYVLGDRLGAERLARLFDRLPLTDAQDVARATDWFERHGDSAVFLGRMVPGVRSFVSIPAGVVRMSVPRFLLLTALGSAVWNGLLIGAGVALGQRWQRIQEVSGTVDAVLVAVLLALLGYGVVRRLRARHE